MQTGDWMLYGAYGITGTLIAEAAVRRGHRPVLAGRDLPRLSAIAGRLGLKALPLSLDKTADLIATIRPMRLIVNAAGPFSETSEPIIEAALAAHVHYLDISGEIDHLRRIISLDARARAAGIALLTGAGFGVTFGDCLARYVMDQLPDATHLRLSVAAGNAHTTATVRRTTLSVLAGGGFAIEGGAWTRRPLGHTLWEIRDGAETLHFAALPMGELAALQAWARAPNIVVGRPMARAAARCIRFLSPVIRAAMSIAPLRAVLSRDKGHPPTAAPEPAGGWRSRVWAEASNASGERVMARLETGEGYVATAAAVLANIEALLTRNLAGTFTPASAFGADHIRTIEGVRLFDIHSPTP